MPKKFESKWLPSLESEKYRHLDLLRFIAAMAIVIGHSAEFWWEKEYRSGAKVWIGGLSLFVDVFFVISGFIVTDIYQNRMGSLADYGTFLRRRVARLFPLHIAILAIQIALAAAILVAGYPMSHPPTLSVHCVTLNALLLHSLWSCNGYAISGVTWSLSAEMVMYICFPLVLLITRRTPIVAALLSAVTLTAGFLTLPENAEWQAFLDIRRGIPSFAFGMALCFARSLLCYIPRPDVLFWLVLLIFLIGWPIGIRGVPLLLLGYAIPALGLAADLKNIVPKWVGRIAILGQITYSVYMIHGIFVLVLLNAIGDKLLKLSALPMVILTLVVCVVTIGVSIFSHKMLEMPARRWIDGR